MSGAEDCYHAVQSAVGYSPDGRLLAFNHELYRGDTLMLKDSSSSLRGYREELPAQN